jgi:hypothetical protein
MTPGGSLLLGRPARSPASLAAVPRPHIVRSAIGHEPRLAGLTGRPGLLDDDAGELEIMTVIRWNCSRFPRGVSPENGATATAPAVSSASITPRSRSATPPAAPGSSGRYSGFSAGARTENRGPEQDALDDVDGVQVSVTRLAPDRPAPRMELLHYHVGTRRPIPRDTASNDLTATHSVIQVASLDPIAAALGRRGTPLTGDDRMVLRGDKRAALISGPDGHRFLAEERLITGQ